ncbi:T9SS type A sorting domain-containing protein [Cloacibacterium sp. TD35]|uniref:T9SS type A sorting domain-containing protein n=1 Tax=Cloacibacterium sp. TD35 TaxID=2976818 RepID=UPI00237E1D5C|nr:T9SS type A sorting domain-containing protein [Cloacibacterium sp. TD35]WDT69153.1 T9SS type A sorting domain-containing protein [Cloacibacterium sp. TD35]
MKKLLIFLLFTSLAYSQTITFSGCVNLFDNQTFVFTKTSTDVNGRNVYQTTPIDGAQDCSGVGTCEFQISWNNTNNRWEFLADRGNGDFSSPFLIYHNSSASIPNPPNLTLGVWTENTDITGGVCGGNLTSGNGTLTGAVQSTNLSTEELSKNKLLLTSNPVKNSLDILSPLNQDAELFDYQGKLIKKFNLKKGQNNFDVSNLNTGIYLLKTNSETLKLIKN